MQKNCMDHVDRIIAQWRNERPDLDVAAMGVVGRIKRLDQFLGQEMEKTFSQHGLTAAGFDVLATLLRTGPPYSLSPGQLIEQTMVTSGTMTHRVDQLVKLGFVSRDRDVADARGVKVCLTEIGHRKISAAVEDHVKTLQRLVASFMASELEDLSGLLRKFTVQFEAD